MQLCRLASNLAIGIIARQIVVIWPHAPDPMSALALRVLDEVRIT
jgi:hypothetical protein